MTVAKLSLWSVNYYNDTARAVGDALKDRQRANGGLAEYYAERDTRTPVWTCAGDARVVADLVGLTKGERGGWGMRIPMWWRAGWMRVWRPRVSADARTVSTVCTVFLI